MTIEERLWTRLIAARWSLAQGTPASQPASSTAASPTGSAATQDGATPTRLDPHDVVTSAYDSFQRDVHSFALYATRDIEAAADVTQEAFLRLLREVTDRGVPENTKAWLLRVASNLVVTGARRRSVADRWKRIIARPEVDHASPESTVLQRERDVRVHAALGELSSDARVALLLAAQGYSGREIAAAIGRTELATRTLVCRAKVQLREQLGSYEAAR